ncbi:capsule biosynthesis protein [Methylobacterium sp. P5_C11]
MNMQVEKASGRPLKGIDRNTVIAQSLRQFARLPGLPDTKKGVRSYQSHVKSDPWLPILFVVCFVLPTLGGAIYYGLIASDRYVTEARFAVRPTVGTTDKATPDSVGTNAGVIKATIAQETLIAQEYIHSRPMVETIAAELPIREWYGRDSIDMFSGFNPDKPVEKFLRYWKRRVDVDVESASGIMSLYVEAFDPDESLAITKAIMAETERMLNDLSMRSRQDALDVSARVLRAADEREAKASAALNDLRNREGVLDVIKSNTATIKSVSELRDSRTKLAVQLSVLQRDLGPQARSIIDLKQQINDLDANIAKVQQQLAGTAPTEKRRLSDALTRFEDLEHERENAEKYHRDVQLAYDRARIVAQQQVVALAPIVEPIKAGSSTEPRRVLMMSIVTAAAAVLFAAAVFIRRVLMN